MIHTLARHKLVLIGISILVALGVWYGLSAAPSSTSDLVTTSVAESDGPADSGLVATLLTLRAVKLDGTILSDPAFTSLKDFSTEIVPEPIGRDNPFAPLSLQASSLVGTPIGPKIFQPRP